MKRNIYRLELVKLRKTMDSVKNTPFSIFAKVMSLTTMNMRYEKVAFNPELKEHPYLLTKKIIQDAIRHFEELMEISFIESDDRAIRKFKEALLENKHRELWQEIWTRHSEKEFEEFVNLKKFRLRINKLGRYIKNKDCVDFGCGNGSFALALIAMGARSVTGIDFGLNSIRYARKMARRRGLSSRVKFYVADILRNKLPGSRFDFAVSNGVFHHLNPIKIPLAVKEVARVLKKGGWFWYYMDGKDAISMDLFDASVEILDSVDTSFTENILRCMNVKRNKMVYLMDGLNATYFHSSYNRVIRDLSSCGFSNFRRLTGGTATDFDLDRIQKDRYGREKFGEGDLRILSQLARK